MGGVDRKHFVLVHGACHGAWSWYKLKPRLESAGHVVTVLDLAASGTNLKKIQDVDTISEYSEPLLQLMATIPPNEKVVLVGHSFGGVNIALAMDKFPEKVAVGVFLTAFVPDIEHTASYVMEKVLLICLVVKCIAQEYDMHGPEIFKALMALNYCYICNTTIYSESTPAAKWLDTEFSTCGNKTSMFFGPKFLSNKLYHNSSAEDLELAKTLVRPGSLFMEDLSKQKNFFKQGYGSVPCAFIVCSEDLGIPLKFQLWMIQNAGINDVLEIKGADHMAMLSKPQELCDSLQQIAIKYA